MKLIVLSNPVNISYEHMVLNSLFEMGLEYFHLRKPDFSKEEMEMFLEKISNKYYNRIVIHSHFELAAKYNLKGIHVKPEYYKMSFKEMCISTSFHSVNEMEGCKIKYEYVFLSPIFDSISKENYRSTFDLLTLKQKLFGRNETIIALGGINEERISIAMDLGFEGVAVLGDVWTSPHPLEKFIRLKNCCEANHKIENEPHA